jgi:hypothetical protein
MQSLLEQFGPATFIGLVAVVMGCLIPLTAIVSSFWYKHRKLQVEATLKHEMLSRGMSAEEIERILRAGSGKRLRHGCDSGKARHTMEYERS